MVEDFQSSKPIYMQIVERIIVDIIRGNRKPGDKMPSVREMALQMGVNPNTIQRTYSELERMGIVETRRGQGTFVSENEELMDDIKHSLQSEIISTFVQKMEEIGIPRQQMIQQLQRFLEEGQ
ncbi:GntR family transcriptional regulator [Bacillus sp. T33-2]|uniref:GntR family transcriptional regulator n=1 Tax=Bacillus sp. T33-2 TaxID=2054168 RepID=UPI000C78BA28|nr:GntR family transcriptional regulator [Bacillus sp. T33-2]PLR95114.1 GntR family transcriptional regulator [Bacillus sp. T33-2]